MLRLVCIGAATLALCGCTTTDPKDAYIAYHLPKTEAQATLDLTLASCDTMEATPTLGLTAAAAAQDTMYVVRGADLASVRVARNIKFTVSDKGVLTGVNAGANDRSAQIIGAVIKVAATVLTAAAPFAGPPECRPEVASAWARSVALTEEIASLRLQLEAPARPGQTPSDKLKEDAQIITRVNTLAKEVADLRTGDGPLHVQTTADLPLDGPPAGWPTTGVTSAALKIDPKPFRKWYRTPLSQEDADARYGLVWSVVSVEQAPAPASAKSGLRTCKLSVAIPGAETVKLGVTTSGSKLLDSLDRRQAAVSASQVTPLAQWAASPRSLCIDVGFGENRTINLAFDAFGRTTEFDWTSDATGENVAGALAGAAPDLVAIASVNKGATLARQKAEIDRLSTQQQLNQWRACEEILAAGGFSCPKGDSGGS